MAERAAKQLELNKSELPHSITEVIATLSRAGFEAYIVGGGVRDTLLGLRPKDFDAVTDAKPHEIKDVFGKRCRIIGRRFQLAHVYSGRELIEVATFRAPPNNKASTNQDGMILRDNVWGDIKQDFARRDFSINALYYQPLKGVVHDFCGALKDIDNKVIRLLGHAPVRIEEDPVRLLRALRFKAKLGFEFDKELSEQFHDDNWALLEQVSPHRLYDETQKMFTGGYLVPLLPLLFESGAIDNLIIYPPSEPSALVKQVAINTDKRIAAGKSINPAFFYAALLWENYLHQLEKAKKRNMPFAEAQLHAASKVIDRQRIKTAIPKFAEQFIRDIWLLQPKLSAPRTKQIEQLAAHPRFRAGFDFLLLREQCGDAKHPLSESTNSMGEWWQTYQTLSEAEQQQAIEDFDENIRRGAYKRGRTRNRQKQDHAQENQTQPNDNKSNKTKASNNKSESNGLSSAQQKAPHTSNEAAGVPSKRRRRTAEHTDNSLQQTKSSDKYTSSAQVQQDAAELEQLRQLSLASTSFASKDSNQRGSQKRGDNKPAPLFVIEQERVVPPLHKQVSKNKLEGTREDKLRDKPENKKSSGEDNKTSVQQASPQETAPSAKADKKTESQQNQRREDKEKPVLAALVPQTPQFVSPTSEPIPHQRRRRQPSTDNRAAAGAGSKSGSKRLAGTSYTKKPPKPAELFEDKALAQKTKPKKDAANSHKTAAAHKASIDKLSSNQGPIPSKRRRRQPSTDSAQSR